MHPRTGTRARPLTRRQFGIVQRRVRFRALLALRAVTPVQTGRLRRSLTFRWVGRSGTIFYLEWRVIYANRVDRTSKRNSGFARSGARALVRSLSRRLAPFNRRIVFERRQRYAGGRLRLVFRLVPA